MTLNGFEIEVFNIHGIKQGALTSICPKCSHDRKKKTEKCAMVDWERGLMTCQHCGEVTQLHSYKKNSEKKEYVPRKDYVRPEYKPFEGLYSDGLSKYIEKDRCLDLSVLKRLNVRECKEWMPQTESEMNCIAFDYFYEGKLINTKFRDGKKNFKLVKNAEKILYNLDSIQKSKSVIFVEGEFDVIAWICSGFDSVVSVPNGFTIKGNINLDFLDNYMSLFDDKDIIYIGVDNDEAGFRGRDELIRRFGAERCKLISYGDQKDANDYLKTYGKLALYNLISSAKDVKVNGIFSVDDVEDSMFNKFKNGQKRGTSTHFSQIDKAWTWREGEVTIWTGYENEGKSLFVNQLALIKAVYDGYKFGFFSPENTPIEDFFNDLIEMYIGKSCDPVFKNNYMTDNEYLIAVDFVKKHFFVIYPDEDFGVENVLQKASYLVKKHGIRGIIFDPYNTFDHNMGKDREDLYISKFMGQMKRFAVKNDISVHLVAHQLTARHNSNDGGRYFKPDIHSIKGGGTFSDKTDNACIIWRPNRALNFRDPEVIFASQKIKKQRLVGEPQEIDRIIFDIKTHRYYIDGFNPLDLIDKQRLPKEHTFDENSGEVFEIPKDVFKAKNINGISQFSEDEYQEPPF